MIQRKQSIYLLLAGLVSMIFAINIDVIGDISLDALFNATSDNAVFSLLYFLSAFISFFSLLMFNNRRFQLTLGWSNIILNILLIGAFLFSLLNLPGGIQPEKGIWAIVPLITIVLLSIANRLIKKDDNLVKSVDRFR